MTDLRTLAQAYLAAREVDATSGDLTASREVTRTGLALGAALGTPNTVPPAAHAAAILAALDAERAQGYARAMRDVVSFDERDPCPVCDVGDWARERLPAAAEKEYGG